MILYSDKNWKKTVHSPLASSFLCRLNTCSLATFTAPTQFRYKNIKIRFNIVQRKFFSQIWNVLMIIIRYVFCRCFNSSFKQLNQMEILNFLTRNFSHFVRGMDWKIKCKQNLAGSTWQALCMLKNLLCMCDFTCMMVHSNFYHHLIGHIHSVLVSNPHV